MRPAGPELQAVLQKLNFANNSQSTTTAVRSWLTSLPRWHVVVVEAVGDH
jgi:hypothetical protein